jgi:hypothetical protein
MAIIGQNALLNQYVPTFYIKDLRDGQGVIYDSVRKAFVNADVGGGNGGVNRLGELIDVSDQVDNPLSLQNGQALVYNSFTSLWENKFLDYNTLLNKPTSSSFSFAGLSDTAKPSLPDGYVRWNSAGTQLIYSTTIPAASITGLATVATTGDYNDLTNKPSTLGTVTTVSVVSNDGVSGVVANPTSTPAITLSLGAITPSSVHASGSVLGSNLSGNNTGDQTITLTGDVTGSGTASFPATLATVNANVGTFGSTSLIPVLTVDAKGRITSISNVPITSGGTGTVTTVSATGTQGVTTNVLNPTSAPAITIGLGNITPTSVAATGTVTGSNLSGINTGNQTITLTGDVTGSGTGTFPATLADTGVTAGLYGTSTTVPRFQVDSKGRILSVSNIAIASGAGTVTSVSGTGNQGVTVSGSPITSSGTLTIGLGAITPASVAASGTISGSNFSGTFNGTFSGTSSGTNTGDQTISLTGDVTGSGTGTFATTLSTTGVAANTYGSSTQVPVFTVDAKGRITGVTNTTITTGAGSVTSVSVVSANGVSGTVANPSTTPAITLSLGAITPTSVAATGTISGSNINGTLSGSSSGTNTGDQTISLTGDVLGTGQTTVPATLSTTGVTAGTYGDSTHVPRFVVDAKGRISSVSSIVIASSAGTVQSVAASGGTTGLSFSGTPITTAGTLILAGTLAISNGGTGATTAAGAINNILPSQAGNNGKVLASDGTNVFWSASGGVGTVTSVAASGSNGVSITGSPITTAGTIAIGLANITPLSVAASGTVTGSNLSGTNTGDQTITLTGDVTGSGTGSFATTLSTTGVTASTYGSGTSVPVFTVDAKGRITSVTNTPVTISGGAPEVVIWHYGSGGSGTFAPVDALYSQTSGVTATVTDAANCIATYTFTGKTNLPKSIATYAQVYSTNDFVVKDTTSLPSAKVAGGGTSAAPALISGFTSSNVVTLQTRMGDTGASAGVGQRAYLIIVFGF